MRPVIIYPPTIDWDLLHQRPQQMLKSLSDFDCICIFCNINLGKHRPHGFVTLKQNLILANGINFHSTVQWARANFLQQPIVAYFTYPPHITEIRSSNVDLIIFDSVDEPVDFFSSWLPKYQESVRSADIVLATARSLVDRAQSIVNDEVHFLPNGCDFDHFKSAQSRHSFPDKLFTTSKPLIGYIGAIAPWLDWRLMNTMAKCLPNYEFIFIGPLVIQRWAAFPNTNMHYLHYKEYSELPKYLSNFTYCLIPFKVITMTKGVNPIKFWEYLASGIPILSTPLPEVYPEYVTTVTEDMFPGFSPTPSKREREERIRLAQDNSWKNRAAKLFSMIQAKLECG